MAKIKGSEWEGRKTGNSMGFILEILHPVDNGKPLGDCKQVSSMTGFVFRKSPLIAVWGNGFRGELPDYRKMGLEAVAEV